MLAVALPVTVGGWPPSFGGNFFAPGSQIREKGVLQMVTYSDLIQIGILIVGIIGLFLQTKKK